MLFTSALGRGFLTNHPFELIFALTLDFFVLYYAPFEEW